MVIRKDTWFDRLEHSSNIGVTKQRRSETRPYHSEKMMRSHVFIVLSEVSVLIRWQQIAPKFSIFSFQGSEVERKAQRIAETFKDAIKDVVHGVWFNSSHIQIMELVFWKLTLFNSLTERRAIWLKSICSWKDNNNIYINKYITVSKQVKIAHMTFVVLRGLKKP